MTVSGRPKRDLDRKKPPVDWRAFLAFTLVGVFMAAALITMDEISSRAISSSGFEAGPGLTESISVPTIKETPVSPVSKTDIYRNSKGSPDAPVTIIEYADFQCYYCQQFAINIEPQLEKLYIATGKVRLVYRHFVIYEDESWKAAEASECASEQSQFWPYYNALMRFRASPQTEDLSVLRLESLAQQLGLDMTLFKSSLESGKYKARVIQDDAEGRALGIAGTPTFFINGVRLNGATSIQALQRIIDPILDRQPDDKEK